MAIQAKLNLKALMLQHGYGSITIENCSDLISDPNVSNIDKQKCCRLLAKGHEFVENAQVQYNNATTYLKEVQMANSYQKAGTNITPHIKNHQIMRAV